MFLNALHYLIPTCILLPNDAYVVILILVMHRYHFLAADTDTDTFRQKMTDTDSIPILLYTNVTHYKFHIILIARFHNAFASLFNKTDTTMLLVGCPYGFKSIAYFPFHYTILALLTGSFKGLMVYTLHLPC